MQIVRSLKVQMIILQSPQARSIVIIIIKAYLQNWASFVCKSA